ncbi:hypothetical protein Tco_0074449, partial [Tanacetum coccineum]
MFRLFAGSFLACISSNHSNDGSEPNLLPLLRPFSIYAFKFTFAINTKVFLSGAPLLNLQHLLDCRCQFYTSDALWETIPRHRGKGVMVDDAAAPSSGVSRPRPYSGPAPLFKDVSGDAIHMDFFPFSAGPYYATYPKGGVAVNYEFTREEWDAPYRPTFGVLTKEVFKDRAVC